ncbi:hypothetical protein QTO34_005616 [Cnephaeus nilssonii]|uniref:Uncharacterized protein n=1 Tax=Cnephaeus nilssonii TaxID=3371016 RepID=A0AA40HNP1_CNENI|nr:hypothetical protein QTO34_005616 [Eptesicus nilssonii]
MGQLESRENALYGQMLKSMLNSKGTKVNDKQDAFFLWNLIRDCLDPRHEHNQPSLKPGKKEKQCNGTKKTIY